ncbi:MAG: HAD family acid phosphatase [Pseudodonghicola sp.]
MDCVVFDIDGTLARFDADRLGHLVHGEVKHWDDFHDAMHDTDVIEPVARLLRRLREAGERIVLCSGRPEGWQHRTEDWLARAGLGYDGIYLRPAGADAWSDPDVKSHLLEKMRGDGFRPWLVVDDRSAVVDFWRAAGLVCLQCAPGEF